MNTITKQDRNNFAQQIATSFEWVYYHGTFYMPIHHTLVDDGSVPAPTETIWIPRSPEDIRDFVNVRFDTLFESEKQLMDFCFGLQQYCIKPKHKITSLLILTDDGLRELNKNGELVEPSGEFIPNTLPIKLNTDATVKAEVWATIVSWLGDSEEEAHALLYNVATMLAPHWASLKYLLLLGGGRNGKSVFLEMLTKLVGKHNRSTVSRQDISDGSTVVTELNNKLANIVMDGISRYLKDSGLEKTLIAGEEAGIRKLYARTLTPVQTNALFIEALNAEPKTTDKSTALQARLVRFEFPNQYTDDPAFKGKMISDPYVGALLALLIDHYVKQQDAPVLLAPTTTQIQLRQGHILHNSLAMQYLAHLAVNATEGAKSLVGKDEEELSAQFKSWRVREGDIASWSDQDVIALFKTLTLFERKSKRVGGRVVKIRHVIGFTQDTEAFLNEMEEAADGADAQPPMVED